jgi:hypothetical protein
MNDQVKTDYDFTPYTHSEIIEAIETYRKRNDIPKSKIATKIGYNDTMYSGLLHGKARFSERSFNRFANKYAPQLVTTELTKIDTQSKEQDCISYLKSRGYKIMKPITEFVEL